MFGVQTEDIRAKEKACQDRKRAATDRLNAELVRCHQIDDGAARVRCERQASAAFAADGKRINEDCARPVQRRSPPTGGSSGSPTAPQTGGRPSPGSAGTPGTRQSGGTPPPGPGSGAPSGGPAAGPGRGGTNPSYGRQEPTPDTNGELPLPPDVRRRLLEAAANMDRIADGAEEYALAGTNRFFKCLVEAVESDLQFLAQPAYVPAAQLAKSLHEGTWHYLTNNGYDNNYRLFQGAVQALRNLITDPACAFGNLAPGAAIAVATHGLTA